MALVFSILFEFILVAEDAEGRHVGMLKLTGSETDK